jgi:hypothetical protein
MAPIPRKPCVIKRWLPLAVLKPLDPLRQHDLLRKSRMLKQMLARLGVVKVSPQQHRYKAAGSRQGQRPFDKFGRKRIGRVRDLIPNTPQATTGLSC